MEDFLIKPLKLGTFIKISFGMLTAVVVTVILALFFLQVNDSVRVSEGAVYSRNPPVEYRSSSEVRLQSVLVNEGDTVYQGDTLLLLQNAELRSEYNKVKENYFLEQIHLNLGADELETLNRKLEEIEKQRQLVYSSSKHTRQNISIELTNLEQKITATEKQLQTSEARLEKDKALFKEGVISQETFETKRKLHLDALNQLSELRAGYQLKVADQSGNRNLTSEQIRQLNLNLINMEQEIINLKKQIFQKETLVETLGVQMNFLEGEIRRLVVKAEQDGVVAQLFNEQQLTRFVPKGTLLALVRPLADASFYARLSVSQSAIAKVQKGQDIHLKIKAYNYYQYGILKGRVSGITAKDSTNQFYLLVDIPEVPEYFDLKSGYRVKGDVILERMPLYRLAMNSLLGKG